MGTQKLLPARCDHCRLSGSSVQKLLFHFPGFQKKFIWEQPLVKKNGFIYSLTRTRGRKFLDSLPFLEPRFNFIEKTTLQFYGKKCIC